MQAARRSESWSGAGSKRPATWWPGHVVQTKMLSWTFASTTFIWPRFERCGCVCFVAQCTAFSGAAFFIQLTFSWDLVCLSATVV